MVDSRVDEDLKGEAAEAHMQFLCNLAELEAVSSDQLWLQETCANAVHVREQIRKGNPLVEREWEEANLQGKKLQGEMYKRFSPPCPRRQGVHETVVDRIWLADLEARRAADFAKRKSGPALALQKYVAKYKKSIKTREFFKGWRRAKNLATAEKEGFVRLSDVEEFSWLTP